MLAAGNKAPEFSLDRLEGGKQSLTETLARGPALVALYKISCPVCQLTFPYLERISKGSLQVIGISQDDANNTRGFLQRFGVTFPTLLDSEDDGYPASNAYGISSVPTIFLIERNGTVSRVIEGWDKREMTALGALAGVKPFRATDSVPEWKAG